MSATRFFLKALKKLRLLKYLNIFPKRELNGQQFAIPILNEVGFSNYISPSEPWMQYLLNRLLRGGNNTIVDVGVNLGQTLLKVKAANSGARYIGFEPNPFCVHYVNQLIKLNNFSNTKVYPVCLSNKSGILKLNLFSESYHDSTASIIEGFRDQTAVKHVTYVAAFRFEELGIDKSIKFDIIKIDVEGAELEVLEGLNEKIRNDRPIILMEVLPSYSSGNISRIERQAKIEALLGEMNYAILRVLKKNDEFVGLENMESFGVHSDLNLCDYILSPVEKRLDWANLSGR